jgi:hypothetical protein
MTRYEVPQLNLTDDERARLEDPARLKLGLPPEGFGKGKPQIDFKAVAVYTFPEAVTENGGPLVFKGSLEDAIKKRSEVMEAASKRRTTTQAIGKVSTANGLNEVSIASDNSTEVVVEESSAVDEETAA